MKKKLVFVVALIGLLSCAQTKPDEHKFGVFIHGNDPTWQGDAFQYNPTTFANLGTPNNGLTKYCSDCGPTNTCSSGGNGAIAQAINGTWVCNGQGSGGGSGTGFPLTADVSAAGHNINGLPSSTSSGQPLTFGQSNAQVTNPTATAVLVSSSAVPNHNFQTSIAITAPSGIVSGNALVAVLALQAGGSQTISPPTGFSLITGSQFQQGGGVQAAFCKIATVSEPGSYTFSWSNSAFTGGGIYQLSGVSCTGGGTPTSAGTSSAASITVPAITNLSLNSVIIDFANYGAGFPHSVAQGRGTTVFAQANSGVFQFYQWGSTTSPAVTYTDPGNGGNDFLGEQVALQSSSSLQSVPVLQGGTTLLQNVTESANGTIDVAAPPYNAACDGVADDAAAIQTALNTGLSVELPSTLPTWPSGAPATFCGTSVPLIDGTTNNRSIFGRSEQGSIIHPYFGMGPAIIEANPTTEITSVGPITATSLLGGGVAMCWNGTGTPCGTATGGSPGQYAIDLKSLTDGGVQGTCGAGTNPLNSCSAGNLTIQGEINTAGGGTITNSCSFMTGFSPLNGCDLILSTNGSGVFTARINIGGTVVSVDEASGWTNNTNHHFAVVFDNHTGSGCSTASCLRFYVDGVQKNSTDAAGSTVQQVFDTWNLGANANHFPGADPGMGGNAQYFDGKIDYFDIEKADLYPSGTTFTPPASKPTKNSNTILLLDFDKPATIVGFGSTIASNGIIGADGTSGCNLGSAGCSNAWTYIRTSPLNTGEIGTHYVHDLSIYNGGEGILGSNSIELQLWNLNITSFHVPLKMYNNSYGMRFYNLVLNSNGEAGIEFGHNTGVEWAGGIHINNGSAAELACYDQACGTFSGLFLNPQLGLPPFNVIFGEDSTFTNFTIQGFASDSESGAPSIANLFLEGGLPNLIGGDIEVPVGANTPAVELTPGTTFSSNGTHFECGDATHPCFKWLSVPTANSPHIVLNAPIINSTVPSQQTALLSDQLPWVDIQGADSLLKASQTINGTTAGTAVCYQPKWQYFIKTVTCVLTGYNSTAQTYTFPVPFLNTPALATSVGVSTSVTPTLINLPTGGPVSGTIIVEGQ